MRSRFTALLVAALLLVGLARPATRVAAVTPTAPSTTSSPALYLSNWQDMMAIWMNSQLAQTDTGPYGPRLGELHYLGGSAASRSVNQIVDYTGYFRDETNNVKYDNVHNFNAEAWFESGTSNAGALTTNYLTYTGTVTQPQMRISRSFVAVPNQPFIVARYTFTNPTSGALTYNVLDQVHLNNTGGADATKQAHGWYDSSRNALIADMSASGQFYVVLGSFQGMDGHQVGNEAVTTPSSATAGGYYSFDNDGTLRNNNDLQASDVDLAFNKRVTVAAGSSQSVYLYLTVRGTLAAAQTAADTARAQTGSSWFDTTASSYNTWFSNGGKGKRLTFADSGINDTYDRALIVTKNSQNPVLGTFVASTNPFAYKYKNWVRDAAVTSIALDASGHYAEAEKYWRWMAGVQKTDGTWATTYSMWDGSYLSFVEPEYDSIGAFIDGVYRHYQLTGDTTFLNDMWPYAKKGADWIINNLQSNGYGPADFSIWEEPEQGLEHNSYTQAWYVQGLYAAQRLAKAVGDTGSMDWYAGGPASIMTAIQRPSTWSSPGTWNLSGYYDRSVRQNNTVNTLKDSSSDALIGLGVVDYASGRASSHINQITTRLTHDSYGLARYENDTYYYTNQYSPAGNEALAAEPMWPQMSMWVAMYEILSGQTSSELARLQWFVSTMGKGYMPQGEAVSWVNHQPIVSSMSEPLTVASFIIVTLMYQGQYAMQVIPPVYNAGAFKTISVSAGTSGDWPQWSNAPYFVDTRGDSVSGSSMTDIKRVYVTNDSNNIYVRVDNAAGSFSGYNTEPKFALHVYSEDFAHAATTSKTTGIYNGSLDRGMNYMVGRWSDSADYGRWVVSGGAWTYNYSLGSVIAPQWDTATGRVEAVIPISSLSSSSPSLGASWANMDIALAYHNPTSGTWTDDDMLQVHYRLSTSSQAWTYGNIEQ